MFALRVSTDPTAALVKLTVVRSRVLDLTPFWRDVFAPQYFGEVQDLFALEGQGRGRSGRFAGGHWTPLSQAYAAWKTRHFPGLPILQRTGRLRASLEWDGNTLGPDGVFMIRPRSVVVGTDVPYAKYHQHGTDTMPARPFLPTPDKPTYSVLLREWIVSGGTA